MRERLPAEHPTGNRKCMESGGSMLAKQAEVFISYKSSNLIDREVWSRVSCEICTSPNSSSTGKSGPLKLVKILQVQPPHRPGSLVSERSCSPSPCLLAGRPGMGMAAHFFWSLLNICHQALPGYGLDGLARGARLAWAHGPLDHLPLACPEAASGHTLTALSSNR